MANGDIASSEAGFTPVKVTDDFRLGYDRINEVADLAVKRGTRAFATKAAMDAVAGKFVGDTAIVTGTGITYRWMPGNTSSSSGTSAWRIWDWPGLAFDTYASANNGAVNDSTTNAGLNEMSIVGGMAMVQLNLYRSAGAMATGTIYATMKAGFLPLSAQAISLLGFAASVKPVMATLDSGGQLSYNDLGGSSPNAVRGSFSYRLAQ